MKKLLLAFTCILSAIAPTIAQAQSPTPDQLGAFLAKEMCANYLATGEFFNDNSYEEVAGKLIAEYGAESALLFFDLVPKLSKSPAELVDDPYLFPAAQSMVTNMAKNDDCFKQILVEEIFTEDKSPESEISEAIDN